jgi:hypothetical protein
MGDVIVGTMPTKRESKLLRKVIANGGPAYIELPRRQRPRTQAGQKEK